MDTGCFKGRATWCPPCRAEMLDMQKYHEDSNEGIILGVNLTETEESMGQVEDFLGEYCITFQVLIDETTEVPEYIQCLRFTDILLH